MSNTDATQLRGKVPITVHLSKSCHVQCLTNHVQIRFLDDSTIGVLNQYLWNITQSGEYRNIWPVEDVQL